MRLLLWLLNALILTNAHNNKFENCTLPSGDVGYCRNVTYCPEIIPVINRGIHPELCGFDEEKHFFAAKIHCQFKQKAILGYRNASNVQWQCGGSLISEKFVLTAAHCLFSLEYGQVNVVRLGELRLDDDENDKRVQELCIVKRIRHPNYKATSAYNDIALLELERPATINKYVRPACLNVEPSHGKAQLIATGWGKLSHYGDPAKHLQKVNLKHFPHDTCSDYFLNNKKLQNGIDNSTQICAGDDGKDTCSGDSGGPLQVSNPDYTLGHRIIGITSFGRPCAITSAPGIYTRVSAYIPWIESIVWLNKMLAV